MKSLNSQAPFALPSLGNIGYSAIQLTGQANPGRLPTLGTKPASLTGNAPLMGLKAA